MEINGLITFAIAGALGGWLINILMSRNNEHIVRDVVTGIIGGIIGGWVINALAGLPLNAFTWAALFGAFVGAVVLTLLVWLFLGNHRIAYS